MSEPAAHDPLPAPPPAPRFRVSDASMIVFQPDGTERRPSVRLIVDRNGYVGVLFSDPQAPVFGYTFWISERAIELTRTDGTPTDTL